MRLVRLGMLIGALCLLVVGCGVTSGAQGTTGAPIATATASPGGTSATPTATVPPGSASTATPATAIQCGQVFQSPDGSVAPPAPRYEGLTRCFTDAFKGCQPAFLEFVARGNDRTRDVTLLILTVKGTCQIYVGDRTHLTNGTDDNHFYYCTRAAQNGAKAVLTGCDTHFTNGTFSIPA